MASAVEVRGDYSADRVRAAAKASSDAGQCRMRDSAGACLLSLQFWTADRGRKRRRPAVSGFRRCATGWPRFNAEGPAALIDRKAPGKPPKLGAAQQAALV